MNRKIWCTLENEILSINMQGGHMPYSIHANCFKATHFYLLSRRNIHNNVTAMFTKSRSSGMLENGKL